MADSVAAYHAGVIDCDGSIIFRGNGAIEIKLEQVGSRLVHWMRHTTGVGHVAHSSRARPRRLRTSRWRLYAQHDVMWYLRQILPHAVKKYDEVCLALKVLEGELPASAARARVHEMRKVEL